MHFDAAASVRQALRTRRRAFAGWVSLSHPSITEMFARTEVDFIGIDLEHSTISLEQSQRIIAAAHAGGVACLPRLASHNGEQIKRLVDSGADGIIVPMVSTRAQVDQLVAWTKYTPIGTRSYGIGRAQGYGFDFTRYAAEWNDRSSIVIQIESIDAVERVDEFLAVDAIDGAMIGPYDLSGSLGVPGQLFHPKVSDACRHVVDACRRHGKGCGTQLVAPDRAGLADTFGAGYTFVVLASDIFVLWKWSEAMRDLVAAERNGASGD